MRGRRQATHEEALSAHSCHVYRDDGARGARALAAVLHRETLKRFPQERGKDSQSTEPAIGVLRKKETQFRLVNTVLPGRRGFVLEFRAREPRNEA